MRSTSPRLVLWAIPLALLGAMFTQTGAFADTPLGWSWDQVSMRPASDGGVECAVEGAMFHYGNPGEPDLPAVLVTIPAPERSSPVSFEITGAVTSDHDISLPITSCMQDRPTDAGGPYHVAPITAAYEALSFPSARVQYLGISLKRGAAWASFAVYPLTLERGHRLILLEQGNLTVHWGGDPNVQAPLKSLRPESSFQPDLAVPEGTSEGSAQVVSDRPSLSGSAVRYIVISPAAFADSLQKLVAWKNETGTPTVLRTTEWIYQNYPDGVDKQEQIRDFLVEAYRYWGAQYLLIVGGPDQVPIRIAKYISYSPPSGVDLITDYYYACLDGTWNADGDAIFGEPRNTNWNPVGDDVDFSPELIVGRIPARSTDQLHSWLSKYWKYEKNPDRGGYLDRTLMMGEVLFNAAWKRADMATCNDTLCPPVCNHVCIDMDGAEDCVRAIDIIDASNVNMGHVELYEYFEYWRDRQNRPGALLEKKSTVLQNLNDGAGWIQHIGHGAYDRISVGTDDGLNSSARILTADIRNGIQNAGRPGIIYSINCTSAAVDKDCIAAAFLFAPTGGEVTYVGSTNLDFPSTARAYQIAFWTKVFHDKLAPGVAFSEAIDENARGLGNEENYRRFLTYSLIYLGDPQMKGWFGTPGIPSVTGPAQMSLGDSTYAVTVTRGGSPLMGATVCAYKAGDAYGVATTGTNGIALVPFRPASLGSFSVWATEGASVPKQIATAPTVVAPGGSVSRVLATGMTIVDGSVLGTSGNGNARFEVGETIDLDLNVHNVGSSAAPNVVFTIRAADSTAPYIQIIKGSHTASVPANGTATLAGAFRVRVRSTVPPSMYQNMDRLAFDTKVTVHDGTRNQTFALPLYAYRPVFRLLSADTHETGGGNGDNRPDNGESILWKPLFRNLGNGTIANMRAYLSAISGALVESDSSDFEGPTEQGNSVSIIQPFQFRVDDVTSLRLLLTVRSVLQRDMTFFSREIQFAVPDTATFVIDADGRARLLESSSDAISVVWEKSQTPDVQGYVLKRATNPGGPFAPVSGDLLTRMEYYKDDGLAGLTRYYYKVAAVDSSGNTSLETGVVSGTTSPPILAGWPVAMADAGYGCPTIENIDRTGANEVFMNSDLMYAFRYDGSEVFDGDHLSTTTGVWSLNGSEFWGKPAIADINNDGVIEIVGASRKNGMSGAESQVLVWSSNGALLWQRKIGSVNMISCPTIANIDGDATSEIVVQNDGGIYAWNHDGTPVIPANTGGLLIQVAAVNFTYGSLAVADVDNDGRDEIIYAYGPASGGHSSLVVVKFNGTSASIIGGPVTIDASGPCNSSPAVLKMGDTYDIFVDTRSTVVAYRWNQTLSRLDQRWSRVNGGLPSANPYDPSVALGDVNGDGIPDVVAAGGFGKLYAFDSQSGNILTGFPIKLARDRLGSPILIDLDNDPTVAEIVVGDNDGTIHAIRGTSGHVGESLPGFPFVVGGAVGRGLACWDIDNDQHPELVIQATGLPTITSLQLTNVNFPQTLADRMVANPWTSFRHDARNTGRFDAATITPVATMQAEGSAEAGAAVIRWAEPPVLPETFRVERSGLDGVWSTRAEGAPSQFGQGQSYSYRDESDPGTYSYRVIGIDGNGDTILQSFEVQVTVLPVRLRLIGAVPNPFNPRTTIRFESPSGSVRLDIVDLAGRHVRTLFSGTVRPGTHDVVWDGRDDAQRETGSGIYFARLHGSGGTRSQKVVLLR